MNLFQDIPVFRKRLLWLGILPGSIILGVGIARYIRSTNIDTLLYSAELMLLAAGWCAGVWALLRRRARTILIKTRGLTCTGCGYSLVGMEENGLCPECGVSYYADHLNHCWSRAAGFPRT